MAEKPISPVAKTFIIVVLFAVFLTGMPTFMFLVIAMLPTVVAMVISARTEPLKWICVGSFNFLAAFPFLVDLWTKGNSYENLALILFNVLTFVSVYGASLIGLVFYTLMPIIVEIILNLVISTRIGRCIKNQEELIDLWGGRLSSIAAKLSEKDIAPENIDINEEDEAPASAAERTA